VLHARAQSLLGRGRREEADQVRSDRADVLATTRQSLTCYIGTLDTNTADYL
jgi:hypothetical protein